MERAAKQVWVARLFICRGDRFEVERVYVARSRAEAGNWRTFNEAYCHGSDMRECTLYSYAETYGPVKL